MQLTLNAIASGPFTPDCPWFARGQHVVYTPDSNGVVQWSSADGVPLQMLLAAGFTIAPILGQYAPGL